MSNTVRYHRSRSKLLGLPVGKTYRFPTFQLDTEGHSIDAVAARANGMLDATNHPWEAGKWWSSPNDQIGGALPMDLLRMGTLTVEMVEAAIATGISREDTPAVTESDD